MNNTWTVYKHTSPSGKVYIGIAKNTYQRWGKGGNRYRGSTRIYNAIQKYGWDNFQHEILHEGLTKDEACQTEVDLIALYKSTDEKYGYNLQNGGKLMIPNESVRVRMSDSAKGHPVSKEVRERLRQARSINVICLETKEVFKNSHDAGVKYGVSSTSIQKNCKNKQYTAGGYHWATLEDYKNNRHEIRDKPKPIGKKIVCIETGMQYDSICEASREVGISRRAISYACNGKYNTSGGFHWEIQ